VIEPGSSLFRFRLLAFPFGTVNVRASRARAGSRLWWSSGSSASWCGP